MPNGQQLKNLERIATYKEDGRVTRWGNAYDGEKSCRVALECFAQGMTFVEVAAELGISKPTIYSWCDRYPAFKSAVELGRTLQEADWSRKGRDNLDNKEFQTSLYRFLSVNQFGWLSERQAMEHSGEIGLALRPVDEGERQERAELARLRAAGEIERLRAAAVEAETRAGIEAVPAGAKVKAIPEKTGGK